MRAGSREAGKMEGGREKERVERIEGLGGGRKENGQREKREKGRKTEDERK